jgi:hypothetical protein
MGARSEAFKALGNAQQCGPDIAILQDPGTSPRFFSAIAPKVWTGFLVGRVTLERIFSGLAARLHPGAASTAISPRHVQIRRSS